MEWLHRRKRFRWSSTPLLTTTPVPWPLLCLSLALLPMAHPPAFWYTNQFELPCCKEKTRSTVIMFAKETFRLLFTMLIVTLSFTNGFIIIKISDDLPTYCSLPPLIRGEDNVFQLLESIHRKIHQPANAKTMRSHVFGVFGNFPDRHLPPIIADMKKKFKFFVAVLCSPAPIGE